jgi:hypothetical protein
MNKETLIFWPTSGNVHVLGKKRIHT